MELQPRHLAVDYSREGATSQTLPTARLLYRDKGQLTGVYLEHHYSPPHKTPAHYPTQHVVAIQMRGAVQAERRLDGRLKQEHIVPGDICIVPAHALHQIQVQAEQEILFVGIEPSALKQLARDVLDPDAVEIIPQFATADPLVHHIGRSLLAALQSPAENRLYAEALSTALGAHLLQHYTTKGHNLQTPFPQKTAIQQAVEYINVHLDSELSLEAIAGAVGLSKYYFCRAFKQEMGLTPWQYVIRQRVEAAKRLLKAEGRSVTEVSQALGFSTQGQFTNFFRKYVGVSPRQYRQRL